MASSLGGQSSFALLSRIIAAIVGGYLLANLIVIALSMVLPLSQAEGVGVGIQISFLVYALVVIWVFSVKKVSRVWQGLALACLVCGLIIGISGGLEGL